MSPGIRQSRRCRAIGSKQRPERPTVGRIRQISSRRERHHWRARIVRGHRHESATLQGHEMKEVRPVFGESPDFPRRPRTRPASPFASARIPGTHSLRCVLRRQRRRRKRLRRQKRNPGNRDAEAVPNTHVRALYQNYGILDFPRVLYHGRDCRRPIWIPQMERPA